MEGVELRGSWKGWAEVEKEGERRMGRVGWMFGRGVEREGGARASHLNSDART